MIYVAVVGIVFLTAFTGGLGTLALACWYFSRLYNSVETYDDK